LRPVLSLFFQQTIGLQTNELPEHNPALKYQVLMLLNEFTALGKIPIVSESMSYLPGYNVRVLLVIQAPSQLREVYGVYAAETMLKSVAARIVFSPKDYPDAKEISDELGFTTVRVRSDSRPSFGAFSRQGGRSRSSTYSQQARSLLLPQEVKEIGNDNALIFYEGVRPIRCQKIRYYNDRRFRARLLPPPPFATPAGRRAKAQFAGVSSMAAKKGPSGTSDAVTPTVGTTTGMTAKEIALLDIEQLESLTLEDLAEPVKNLSFEHLGERPTDEEIEADVSKFIEAMRAA
jgi:type IV secretion system protein VirD4